MLLIATDAAELGRECEGVRERESKEANTATAAVPLLPAMVSITCAKVFVAKQGNSLLSLFQSFLFQF